MAQSDQITASYRRNTLRFLKEMKDIFDTSTGHTHDGSDSASVSAGANTLDQAYDQGGVGVGRAITVNDGAITMTKNDTGTENVLEISASPSSAAAGDGLKITCGGNSTGSGISFANTGSGNDITGTAGWNVTKAGVATFDSASIGAITLVSDTAPAGTVAYITNDNTGDVNINALTGKQVEIRVAGTNVIAAAGAAITLAQAVTISTGGLTVSDTGLTVTAGGATIGGVTAITGATTITGSLTVTVQGAFDNVSTGQVTLVEDVLPAGTVCYIGRDGSGDVTANALTGKEIHLAIAGTDMLDVSGSGVEVISGGLTVTLGGATITGVSTITGNTTVTGTLDVSSDATVGGDLTVTGSLTYSGNWTTAATLTVDELILDTDGVAPAGTNAYVVSDNTGDLTLNALTGKTINLAINNTDEYAFSATTLDMNTNALDNCGYVILNAATAPANTEVYLVNDNTGDLTLNALTGKTINFAVAGTDEVTISGAQMNLSTNTLTGSGLWTPAGGVAMADQKLDFTTGYIEVGATNPAASEFIRIANNTFLAASRNAANGADVTIVKVNASDLIEFGANLAATTMGGTLTLAAQQLSLTTGNVTFSGAGYVSIGANPAASGYIRLSNAVSIAARNAANNADITALTVNASDDLAIGADIQLGANVIYGDTAADGNLVLHSTIHATKGYVGIPTGHEGLKIGGTVDRQTAVGDNVLHIFDGAAAPSGTLANGGSLYSEGGELKVLDAAGNSTTISPHTEDGDYVIHSFSAGREETVTIHLEKLVKELVKGNKALAKFVTVASGHTKRPIAMKA